MDVYKAEVVSFNEDYGDPNTDEIVWNYMLIYDKNNELLRNHWIGIAVPVFLWIPPILYSDYKENQDWLVWVLFDYSTYWTDDDGGIWVPISIGYGKIGQYIISFEFGTTFNMPI